MWFWMQAKDKKKQTWWEEAAEKKYRKLSVVDNIQYQKVA